MNTSLVKKIMLKIQNLDAQISSIEETQFEIASNGYASASISSTGGSKSYTKLDLPKITALINSLKIERKKYQLMLGGNQFGIGKILHFYC